MAMISEFLSFTSFTNSLLSKIPSIKMQENVRYTERLQVWQLKNNKKVNVRQESVN